VTDSGAATWRVRAEPLADIARRIWRELPRPWETPFTFWYLVLLFCTTLILRHADPHTRRQLLHWSSTDVRHLTTHPARVLVASTLWLPSLHWLREAVLFSLVLAPVERRIGSWETIGVFLSGHILATLATEVPVAWMIGHGYLPHRMAHVVDVGVSYGFATMTGVLVCLLGGALRALALVLAEWYVWYPLLTHPDMTSAGHLISLHIGLAWYFWLRPRGVTGSIRLSEARA
jgi:hypothetical protein